MSIKALLVFKDGTTKPTDHGGAVEIHLPYVDKDERGFNIRRGERVFRCDEVSMKPDEPWLYRETENNVKWERGQS